MKTALRDAFRRPPEPVEPASPAPGARQSEASLRVATRARGGVRAQAQLVVGAPDDAYEREAERVSDEVTRAPGAGPAAVAAGSPPAVRRLSAGGAGAPGVELPPAAESYVSSTRGGGEELPAPVRAYFEPRFGRDLSDVRVHADGRAAGAARSLGARAFTLGSDVHFGVGQYNPSSARGRRLIAHELTHVAQQTGGGAPRGVVQRDLLDVAGSVLRENLLPPHPADLAALPLNLVFQNVIRTSLATATGISIPWNWMGRLAEYASTSLMDGPFLLKALSRFPSFYRNGAILHTQPAAGAMTLDHYIFVRGPLSLSTYAHEMTHVAQYGILGNVPFLISYFGMSAATIAAGWLAGTPVNPMKSSPHEFHAYALEARFKAWHLGKYGTNPDTITV